MEQPLKIPKHEDVRGNLSFIEHSAAGVCPFEIQRVYWVYDVPAGRVRHGRALRHTSEMVVAMSGSFTVCLEDSDGQRSEVFLDRSDRGVVIPPGTWRELKNFSTNAVAMVLASAPYDPEEYIYEYREFSTQVKA